MPQQRRARRRRRPAPRRNRRVVPRRRPRPRRPQRRARRSGLGQSRAITNVVVRREFVTNAINGDSAGYITLGPDNSQAAWLRGFLQSYHHYLITNVTLHWMSAAASTAAGLMSYDWDTTAEATGQGVPVTRSFKLTQNGSASASGRTIATKPEYESGAENQLRIVYRGSGASSVAGYFRVEFTLQQNNPK
jgi:hypothetical protein